MTDPSIYQDLSLPVIGTHINLILCTICGLVVGDLKVHEAWHSDPGSQ